MRIRLRDGSIQTLVGYYFSELVFYDSRREGFGRRTMLFELKGEYDVVSRVTIKHERKSTWYVGMFGFSFDAVAQNDGTFELVDGKNGDTPLRIFGSDVDVADAEFYTKAEAN